MAQLPVNEVDRSGFDATAFTFASAAAGGDTYSNNDRTFLVVRNDDATPMIVRFVPTSTRGVRIPGHGPVPFDVDGATPEYAVTVTVPNGTERWILAPPKKVNNGGQAQVQYSKVTSVTVAVGRLKSVN